MIATVVQEIASLLLLTVASADPAAPPGGEPPWVDLTLELDRLVSREKAVVGLAAVHLPSGQAVEHDGRGLFPMQSVYKLPIAIAVLAAADAGKLALDRKVEIRKEDISPGPDPRTWAQLPQTVTVSRLLELMIQESDNTACDNLLKLVGGGPAVTALLRERGVTEVTVSRPERQITAEVCRLGEGKDCKRLTPEEKLRAIRQQVQRRLDVATPRSLADLLVALHKGKLLSAASTNQLLTLMAATVPGAHRLRGLLPPGTPVAHRTGTGPLVVNDIGLITLPGNRGTLAVAVLIKETSRPTPDSERTIAEVARALYHHFPKKPRPPGR